jgi:hypothetical protein
MPRRKEPKFSDVLLDQLLAGADPRTAFNPNGLLDGLKKPPVGRADRRFRRLRCRFRNRSPARHVPTRSYSGRLSTGREVDRAEPDSTSIASRLLGGSDGVQYHAR